MRPILTTALVGLGAGLAASFLMDRFQGVAAGPLGMDERNDDPSTVKAADTVNKAVEGRPVEQQHRALAGSAVHYGVGAAIGVGYALAARRWPAASTGDGAPLGLATMLLLDDQLVPAAGWGPWPAAEVAGNAYALGSHLVFGTSMEGMRRAGEHLLG